MRIIGINKNNLNSTITEAKNIILNDGLIIYPTETVYGLGANAKSVKAVRKVFAVKGRKYNKPISITLHSIKEAEKIVEWNKYAEKLARNFLPGPLTLILKLKVKFPKRLTCGEDKIGIRIPDHPITLELIKRLKVPVTATSANISGGKAPINAKEAIRQIGGKVDLVIDAGVCKYKKPSTVIDLTGKPRILRVGVISKKEIDKVLQG